MPVSILLNVCKISTKHFLLYRELKLEKNIEKAETKTNANLNLFLTDYHRSYQQVVIEQDKVDPTLPLKSKSLPQVNHLIFACCVIIDW